MISQIKSGGDAVVSDLSDATLLVRGCDPTMAAKAQQFLPSMLGLRNSTQMVSTTDDVDFFDQLSRSQWDIVMFAPGACRWSEAKQPIPGGNEETKNWSLSEYRVKVRKALGENIQIVETTDEKNIVPLLREALTKL